MTKEEFHKILIKSKTECNAVEIHLRHLFENSSSKRIFALTGLDFSDMLKGEDTSGIQLKRPTQYFQTVVLSLNI